MTEQHEQHEALFNQIKERISEDTILAVPSTEDPFHIHVDTSNVGTGCILVQQFPEGKRIVSFHSRVFDKAEQKLFTFHRELCGIVSALQTYEHYIIGSLLLLSICTVITNLSSAYGDKKDNYLTDFSNIKSS